MTINFSKILIPVDFSVNTRVAIRKALFLCEGANTAIHLLHVMPGRPAKYSIIHQFFARYSYSNDQSDIKACREKLEQYRNYILSIRPDIEIATWITIQKSIEEAIIEKSKNIGAELIVIGTNSHHSWLPFLNTVVPATIAKKSGIAVLTVKPGAVNDPIRTVVVPVGDGFPYNKVAAVNALKKRFRFQTRLVTFRSNQDGAVIVPGSVLNAYRVLKNNPESQVSYEVLHGNNRAKAILDYCARVNADLLIVNPDTEMKIGWLNRQIPDVLPVHSKTQILAINQI
jgi:nucleotide-binding universal stress UspA family protein